MSTQITVRLPDGLVEFVDRQVERGELPSRAAAVAAALEHERRRSLAEHDVAILSRAREGQDGAGNDDFDDLATFAAQTDLGDLD